MISVLLTSYNRERYIAESIESVLAQTCRDFELIVTDNCSTDRSAAIAREYAKQDDRVRRDRQSDEPRTVSEPPRRREPRARRVSQVTDDSDDVMNWYCLAGDGRGALDAEPRAGFALSGSRDWPGPASVRCC